MLVALILAGGIYLGGRTYFRKQKVELHDWEQWVMEIVHAPKNAKKILTEGWSNTVSQIWRGGLVKKPCEDCTYLGSEALPLNKYYLYSNYDYAEDEITIVLHDLQTNDTLRYWNLPYELAYDSVETWRARNEHRYQVKFEGNYERIFKTAVPSPRLFGENKVVFNLNLAGVACLDKNSDFVWHSRAVSHHSLEIGLNKTLWISSWAEDSTKDYRDDAIVQLDQHGKKRYEKRIREIVLDHPQMGVSNLFNPGPGGKGDPYHLNDVEPVMTDSEAGYWKKGDVLISLRNVNMVFLFRPSTDSVLWFRNYPWMRQHDVSIVNDSVISVFDNHVELLDMEDKSKSNSTIVFYHFSGDSTTTPFDSVYKHYDAYTYTQGRAQYFDKDSLLFTEISDPSFSLIHDQKNDTTYQLILQVDDADKVGHMRWNRLYSKEQLPFSALLH